MPDEVGRAAGYHWCAGRRPETTTDIAIIGAGPAGGAAAIALARAGRRVVLIERRRFPRDKVCGGCLSGAGVAQLQALVGPDRRLPGIPASRLTFVIGNDHLACNPRGATRVVLRSELDAWLADIAASAGAEIWYGQPASLIHGETGWDVMVGATRVRAGSILVAAGLGGLPRTLGIDGRPQARRLVAQQWLQPLRRGLPELGCVELHWLSGGYVGLATPVAGRCLVAYAAETPEHPGEAPWLMLRRLNPDTPLWSALPADAPRRYGAKGSAGFPWTPRRLGSDNVLLIGDAAGYEEPFTGEGMGQALGSAACAARAVLDGHDVLAQYAALMRRHHRSSAWRLRVISRVLRHPLIHFLAAGPELFPRRWLAGLVEWVHVKVPA